MWLWVTKCLLTFYLRLSSVCWLFEALDRVQACKRRRSSCVQVVSSCDNCDNRVAWVWLHVELQDCQIVAAARC